MKQKANSSLTYFNLLHAIKAAGNVADDERIIVFGSNAILPWVNSDMEFHLSMDIDMTFFDDESGEKINLVDGCLGELSNFHDTFGYWVHDVPIDESRFPHRWRDRLVKIEDEYLDGKIGYILSPPDLAVVKLAAGRPKDLDFVEAMLRYGLTDTISIYNMITLLPNKQDTAMMNFTICKQRIVSQREEKESHGMGFKPHF